jgi:hypothetical protein
MDGAVHDSNNDDAPVALETSHLEIPSKLGLASALISISRRHVGSRFAETG